MSQSAQQFFDVQAQAGPTPFVIHFLQSTVTESSQTQQTFEVSEWCLVERRSNWRWPDSVAIRAAVR